MYSSWIAQTSAYWKETMREDTYRACLGQVMEGLFVAQTQTLRRWLGFNSGTVSNIGVYFRLNFLVPSLEWFDANCRYDIVTRDRILVN